MKKKFGNDSKRKYRHLRIRQKVVGTRSRPRLCVFRSNGHLEAQLIDDLDNRTFLSLSTRDKTVRANMNNGGNVTAAKSLGTLFAEKAISQGYQKVVFDRSGYLYQGRVQGFAESAREKGLQF